MSAHMIGVFTLRFRIIVHELPAYGAPVTPTVVTVTVISSALFMHLHFEKCECDVADGL